MKIKRVVLQLVTTATICCSSIVNAEFSLNFTPNPNLLSNIANVHCTTGGGDGIQPGVIGSGSSGFAYYGCGSGYFIQEVVNEPGAGDFFHVIIGDPSVDDFAMEFYISGNYNSASGGNWNNAHDPLGDPVTITGNGTGNPNRLYMRMINNDANFNQEFLKATLSQKPLITQNISDNEMIQEFVLDMSNARYDQANIRADIINKLTLPGPSAPRNAGNFDFNGDSQHSSLTAGRYIYNAGPGPENSMGTYTYEEGNFNILEIDWLSYCDPAQNPDRPCDFIGQNNGPGGGGMMGNP